MASGEPARTGARSGWNAQVETPDKQTGKLRGGSRTTARAERGSAQLPYHVKVLAPQSLPSPEARSVEIAEAAAQRAERALAHANRFPDVGVGQLASLGETAVDMTVAARGLDAVNALPGSELLALKTSGEELGAILRRNPPAAAAELVAERLSGYLDATKAVTRLL